MGGSATDRLEHELLSELENARLVRLLCKFGFINERPEFVSLLFHAGSSNHYFLIGLHWNQGGPKQATDILSNYSEIMSFIK